MSGSTVSITLEEWQKRNPDVLTEKRARELLDSLSMEEASACFNSLSWKCTYNSDVLGMDKLKPLFTSDNGTHMHFLVRDMVLDYFSNKFQSI